MLNESSPPLPSSSSVATPVGSLPRARPMARIRARAEYGLAAVLLVAGVVRFWGLGYGLPHSFYPDESTVMGDSLTMASSGDLRPSQFLYPSLWLYVLA